MSKTSCMPEVLCKAGIILKPNCSKSIAEAVFKIIENEDKEKSNEHVSYLCFKKFDDIEYCKDCDFLYEDPEVLIWSNDKTAKVSNMLGTGDDFILSDFFCSSCSQVFISPLIERLDSVYPENPTLGIEPMPVAPSSLISPPEPVAAPSNGEIAVG